MLMPFVNLVWRGRLGGNRRSYLRHTEETGLDESDLPHVRKVLRTFSAVWGLRRTDTSSSLRRSTALQLQGASELRKRLIQLVKPLDLVPKSLSASRHLVNQPRDVLPRLLRALKLREGYVWIRPVVLIVVEVKSQAVQAITPS